MSYRVFLSHGWADRWLAAQMARLIRDAGAEVFIDVFDIAKGDDFEERIFGALPGCDELVVLLTPHSAERNWVWVEIGAARVLGRRIVPFLYGVTLDQIAREKGGTTFLTAKNVADINDFDDDLAELRARRAGGGA